MRPVKTTLWISLSVCTIVIIVYAYYFAHLFQYNKKPPEGGFLRYQRLAIFEWIEFDNQTEDREGDTSTNIDGINHANVELIAIVWFDV